MNVNGLIEKYGRFGDLEACESGAPTISVVIPARNERNRIYSTLSAVYDAIEVYRQHGGNAEVIVADNGSSDGTSMLAEQFGAKVVYVDQKGISNARNGGYANSSGDVVLWVDADTHIKPDTLLKVAESTCNGNYGGVVTLGSLETDPISDAFLGWSGLVNELCNSRYLSPIYRLLGDAFPIAAGTAVVYLNREFADGLVRKTGELYPTHVETGEDRMLLTKARAEADGNFGTVRRGALTSNRRYRGQGPIEQMKSRFDAWNTGSGSRYTPAEAFDPCLN